MPVDVLKLRNPEALLDVLGSHPEVRYLISGHVHHPTSINWHGYACYTVGACTYKAGLHVTGSPGPGERYYGPAYYTVALMEPDQMMVHHHDFLYGYPELAKPLFQRIHQDFGLSA